MESLGIKVIEVILGLIFIYLLLSILVSLVNEIINTNLNLRGYFLKKAIVRMLDDGKDKALSDKFYNHPLIKKLKPKKFFIFRWFSKHKHHLPSYISKETFTKVLIDILNDGNQTTITNLRESILKLPEISETRSALLALLNDAESKLDGFKKNVSFWFDESMEKLTGVYKKYNQYFVFIIGFVLTVVFNVDTIYIARELTDDKETRAQITAMAINFVEEEKDKIIERIIKNEKNDSIAEYKIANNNALSYLNDKTDSLKTVFNKTVNMQIAPYAKLMGIGWEGKITQPQQLCKEIAQQFSCFKEAWLKLVGWLLTALAVSLGAPFWFDMLNKIIKFRASVKKT